MEPFDEEFSFMKKKIKKNRKDSDIVMSYPTLIKVSNLAKPDFSPLINKENSFSLKINGSYKKRKLSMPESPIKTPKTKDLTPMKIEGKDLFGSKQNEQSKRKLNFDNVTDESLNIIFNEDNVTKNNGNNFFCESCKSIEKNEKNIENNRMENDFTILKTLSIKKFDEVFKVEENKTKKIYCIKKTSKNSSKNDYKTIQKIFIDIYNNSSTNNANKLGSEFFAEYLDYWFEEENYGLEEENLEYNSKNLFILMTYYPHGDILDYLEKLEQNNYKFTSSFYWDMIFEMMLGLLYFHNSGYLHLDIKPTNFLVDNKGYIKLNDFGLSHKMSELCFLEDIIEGDSAYISKEVFNSINISNLNSKSDVFSLGLTLLEIMAKIDLPSNGKLWQDIRDENFIMPKEFLNNWNIKENETFLKLISQMILPLDKRPYLIELINQYPELLKRYELLKTKQYQKSAEVLLFCEMDNAKNKIYNLNLPSIPSFDSLIYYENEK